MSASIGREAFREPTESLTIVTRRNFICYTTRSRRPSEHGSRVWKRVLEETTTLGHPDIPLASSATAASSAPRQLPSEDTMSIPLLGGSVWGLSLPLARKSPWSASIIVPLSHAVRVKGWKVTIFKRIRGRVVIVVI